MDRYANVHKSPRGPGDTRPTAEQILGDQEARGKLVGKTVLITGGTGGLGYETARVLRLSGAKVFISGRSQEKADAAAKALSIDDAYLPVSAVAMDLGDLNSVRLGAAEFLKQSQQLNIYIANAGIMACPESQTINGYESQFAIDHLAHFLLFHLLKPTLIASATPEFHSRVIVISSVAHRIGSTHPGNYNLTGEYNEWAAYGQAKLANVLMALQLEKLYGSDAKLHGLSLHPGMIADTGLHKHQGGGDNLMSVFEGQESRVKEVGKTLEQGAATQVWAAIAKELEGKGGLYLDDCQVAGPWKEGENSFGPGYGTQAYDAMMAEKLWNDSLGMVEITE